MLARHCFSNCARCAFSALEKESIRKDQPRGMSGNRPDLAGLPPPQKSSIAASNGLFVLDRTHLAKYFQGSCKQSKPRSSKSCTATRTARPTTIRGLVRFESLPTSKTLNFLFPGSYSGAPAAIQLRIVFMSAGLSTLPQGILPPQGAAGPPKQDVMVGHPAKPP